jgi:hypothetical protein
MSKLYKVKYKVENFQSGFYCLCWALHRTLIIFSTAFSKPTDQTILWFVWSSLLKFSRIVIEVNFQGFLFFSCAMLYSFMNFSVQFQKFKSRKKRLTEAKAILHTIPTSHHIKWNVKNHKNWCSFPFPIEFFSKIKIIDNNKRKIMRKLWCSPM